MIFVFVFVEPVKVALCGMDSTKACDKCNPHFGDTSQCMYYDPLVHGGTPATDQCNLSPRGGCHRPTEALQTALTICIVMTIVFIFGIICCQKCSREYPTNYLALFSFTACEAVVLGITCLFVNSAAVGLAAAMTALVTAGLSCFACFTKIDFTGMGAYLYAGLLSLIVCGFVGSFFSAFYQTEWIQNVYAGVGCLIFSAYIVFDTQLIVGGKHAQHAFNEDDYVFAALNIYLDIVNLFIYILSILNDRN